MTPIRVNYYTNETKRAFTLTRMTAPVPTANAAVSFDRYNPWFAIEALAVGTTVAGINENMLLAAIPLTTVFDTVEVASVPARFAVLPYWIPTLPPVVNCAEP